MREAISKSNLPVALETAILGSLDQHLAPVAITRQGINDVVGKVEKPNPPTPFPAREGGASKPLPASGRGWGGVKPRSWLTKQNRLFPGGLADYPAIQNPFIPCPNNTKPSGK